MQYPAAIKKQMRPEKGLFSATPTIWLCLLMAAFCLFTFTDSVAQSTGLLQDAFSKATLSFTRTGRGICKIVQGTLVTREAYAGFGDSSWANYQFTVDAKVPASAPEVQIWCGFHARDRKQRYVLALRGGSQNDLYLARIGHMGTDDFIALRPLHHPLKPGKIYRLKVQVAGERIRVFLDHDSLPRIDVRYPYDSLAPAGKITLGGSWIENDFTHLSIHPLSRDAFKDVPMREYAPPTVDKEAQRKVQRGRYQPIRVSRTGSSRTVITLDGKWLFKPAYELSSAGEAVSPDSGDRRWHILPVPDFWNPDRIWLFGERYKSASKGVSDSYYQKEIDRCSAYTFDYRKTNIGWYRQWVDLPPDIRGKHLTLHFDAVSKLADIWINGKKAGTHTGMFGDSNIDGTGLFKPGKNLIAVKVYRNYLSSDQNSGKVVSVAVSEAVTERMLKDLPHGFFDDDPAGIWQPVSLIITNPVKIADVFIKPGLHGAVFNISLKNYGTAPKTVSIGTRIRSAGTGGRLYAGTPIKNISLEPGASRQLNFTLGHLNPLLWSPAHPNLYDFNFFLTEPGGKVIDSEVIRSGFKTFEVKNGFFLLNGHRYWLRGANQTAMPLAPNDSALADRFCQLMRAGNITFTRTHTTPYTATWMDASDKNGIGISFEGTWPWLMIADSPIPDTALLHIWKNEFLALVKKYRNHPSLCIWTINNEMNFYASDHDKQRAEKKMEIISDIVRQIRTIDPTHPVCFSSNYSHKQTEQRFGKAFMSRIDDGDIDDIHYYPNWYNKSIFADFNGQFQQQHKYPQRPLISQELSTGYTDETGHPVRFYTLVHQTPQAMIGNYAYGFNDPTYFLKTEAFITKEEAEALRRTNPKAAGILHFSLATWFTDVYKAKNIRPFPVYFAAKKALQPVLVSAELWGRHYYTGTKLPIRICIVNDQNNAEGLAACTLEWMLTTGDGKVLARGSGPVPPVPYYGRQWITPEIRIPGRLPQQYTAGKLTLRLIQEGHLISANDYHLFFAGKNWAKGHALKNKKIVVADPRGSITPVLNSLGIPYSHETSIQDALKQKADVLVLTGSDSSSKDQQTAHEIEAAVRNGARILWLDPGPQAGEAFPDDIRGIVEANPEIANMVIDESPVFNQLDPLSLRYFNDNRPATPTVCAGSFQINRSAHLETLASSEAVHGYLQGSFTARSRALDKIKGFPIVKIEDGKGKIILSTMQLGKGVTDPVAGKLLTNLLAALTKR